MPSWTEYPVPGSLPPVVIQDPSLPLVSIVTPSYNQGAFVRETIESVLNQDYPNVEYWVIDGGSTDETVSILKQYEGDSRFHWLSEKDKGQADAVNKGWSRCRGEILGWLNSDDYYLSDWVFNKQVQVLRESPLAGLAYSDCYYVDSQGTKLGLHPAKSFSYSSFLRSCYIPQPTVFVRRQVVEQVGTLDTQLRLALDYDYWLRCSWYASFEYTALPMAAYRLHDNSKTVTLLKSHALEACKVVRNQLFDLGVNDSARVSRQEKKTILASALLAIAINAVKAGDLRLARRMTKRSWRLTRFDPRLIYLLLAIVDYRLGTDVQTKAVELLYAMQNLRSRSGFKPDMMK